ncbi:hypothetical protein BAE44_0000398 [Dichanthelium oligosanthes]|uniref:Cadmium-induced protein AS8 n=1 Tax=Dichanthelium oligosanthes TaxID=888268 RepID=A0A1E5WN47_9POAL|nr:hypothetical protein BAE44_0000398 [Dichanthelium oligosanthes]
MPDSPQLHDPPPPPAPPPPPPLPPAASPTPAASAAANAQPKLVLQCRPPSISSFFFLQKNRIFAEVTDLLLFRSLVEIPVKPRMIIKGVLGRYERWNPVHPTAGTFWGVGLGLGCGVGWGPGFGPEVIGYVGAGCGVGFSVGFTLAGVGIGLPQHGLIRNHDDTDLPSGDAGFASNVPLDSARFYAVTIIRGFVWDAISYAGNVAAMRKESRQKLLRLQDNTPVSGGVDLPKLGKGVSSSIRSTMECIRAFKDQHWPP